MFSYVARFFSAIWAILCALFASAANKDSSMNVGADVPSAATDAEAGVDVYSTLSIAQTTAQTCYLENVEELRPRDHFEVPTVAASHGITSGSSLYSLGGLSTIEEVDEEDDIAIDVKDQEAGGAEAMADIVRTTWSATREYEEYGFEGASYSCQSWARYDDAESCHNSIISSSVGYDDLQMLLAQEGEQEEDSTHENIDGFIGLQELTPTSSRYSLGRLSTIEEIEEEEEVDAVHKQAMEENEVAWMARPGSNDDTYLAYTEGSMTLESHSLQVAQWRQLVHEASDSDATSPFAFSAMYIKKTDAISFDDWSRSSFVSPPPTPTYESPDGRHTSPSSKAGRVRCATSRQLLCSPLLTNASSPSLSATSSTSSLIATPPLGCSKFGYYPSALAMPSFLGSPELISGENEKKSSRLRPSFVPDVFDDVYAEECASSAGSTLAAVTVAAVEIGADVLFPKISGSISFGELLGEFPTADKLFEGIPCLGSYETLYLKPAPLHEAGVSANISVPASISSHLSPTCSNSRAVIPAAVDSAKSKQLEFPSADKLFEGIPSLGSFETLYLKPALPLEASMTLPAPVTSSPDKPSVGETTPMPPSSSLPAIIHAGFVDDSESEHLEDGLIPATVGSLSYSVADRSGYEASLAAWILFCLLFLPSLTFSSFISSLL